MRKPSSESLHAPRKSGRKAAAGDSYDRSFELPFEADSRPDFQDDLSENLYQDAEGRTLSAEEMHRVEVEGDNIEDIPLAPGEDSRYGGEDLSGMSEWSMKAHVPIVENIPIDRKRSTQTTSKQPGRTS